MTDARIMNLTSSDLFQRPLADAGPGGDGGPTPLTAGEPLQNEVVNGLIHARIVGPLLGFVNPLQGQGNPHTFPMSATRKRKVPGYMRYVLARNIEKLIEQHLGEAGDKPLALAKASGLSKSTVQRILARETGASLDNIEALAEAFDVSVYQLMLPALDPANPQVVKGAAAEERRLYRAWQTAKLREQAVKEAVK